MARLDLGIWNTWITFLVSHLPCALIFQLRLLESLTLNLRPGNAAWKVTAITVNSWKWQPCQTQKRVFHNTTLTLCFLRSFCILFRDVPWALVVVYKINSAKTPDRWGRYPRGPAPYWGAADSWWLLEAESFFFECVVAGGFPMLLWVASYPCTCAQHQVDLLGYWKQRKRTWI